LTGFIINPLANKAAENGPNLAHQLRWLHRLGFRVTSTSLVPEDTVLEVTGEHFEAERIQGGPHGGNLVQNVNTVAILFKHPLDSGDLAGHAFHAS
jgi:hypothetical protein